MILLPLLLLATLGAALLAPFLAGHAALLAEKGEESRLAGWFGLTVGAELATTLPLGALAVGCYGPAEWRFYYLAFPFALLSLLLGLQVMRAHARRLRGEPARLRLLPLACVGFASALALALLPWILGAPMPFGAGEFGAEQSIAGDAGAYAVVVLPVVLALAIEAWLLARVAGSTGTRRHGLGWAASGLGAFLLLALVVLPRSHWSSRHVAARERAALRSQAASLDQPRREALAEIMAGRLPRLLSEPCPTTPEAWLGLARFAEPPARLGTLWETARAWHGLDSVDLWLSGTYAPSLDGPLHRAVFTWLDESAFGGPWPERDWLVSAEEARRRTWASVRTAPWQADGTLVVTREAPSFASYGKANLGFVHANLWLWSYHARAFVCGGQARVPYQAIEGMFSDAQKDAVRDALRMRALALAIADLRALEH